MQESSSEAKYEQSTGSMRAWWARALSFLVPAAIALSWSVAYLSQEVGNLEELFDSDGLTLELLWVDIIQNGGHWSDWYLPHAPRFLPDMALYFGVRGLVPDEYWAIYLFGLVMLFLVYIPAIWLAKLLGESRPAVSLTQCTTLLTFSFLAVEGLRPYSFTFAPTFHTGILIHGLLLVILYTYLRRNPNLAWTWVAIGVLAAVGAACDLLFALAYLVPFCGVLLLGKLLGDRTHGIRLVPLVAIATGVGLLVKNQLIRDTTPAYLDFSKSWDKVWTFPATFMNMLEQDPLTSTLCCTFYFLLFLEVAKWFRRRLTEGREIKNPFPFWQLTFLISACILLLAFAIRGLFEPMYVEDIKNSRLIISIPFNAILLPWLPFKESLKRSKAETPATILVYIAVIAVIVKFNPMTRQYYSTYRPAWIAEFDQRLVEYEKETGRKLRRGVSTYWPTKTTLALTRHDLSLGQYTSTLDRYYCLNSTEWYHDDYDFAIADFSEYDREFLRNLISSSGQPEKIFRCQDLRLVVFPPNALKVENFQVDLWKMRPGPSVERLSAGDALFSPAGKEGNYITMYGPYVRLAQGQYEVTLQFSVGDQDASGIFRCEVYSSEEDVTLQEKKIEIPTAERTLKIKIPFEISKAREYVPIEFRVWKNGVFDLTLDGIGLEELESQ
jgi:hypothetical protein